MKLSDISLFATFQQIPDLGHISEIPVILVAPDIFLWLYVSADWLQIQPTLCYAASITAHGDAPFLQNTAAPRISL